VIALTQAADGHLHRVCAHDALGPGLRRDLT
jgi:hypothetical protein